MRAFLACVAALVAGLAVARTVSLGAVVCNPGARLTVPIEVDDVTGVASVYVRVTYDPLVLALAEVRPGTLQEAFGTDFVTAADAGSTCVLAFGRENATSGSGSVAELVFEARPGCEGMYSDVALAEARLEERTQTADLTVAVPLEPVNGMVRAFAADGTCETRQGAATVTVAAETTLRRLTLAAGDALEASASAEPRPITVTEALAAEGTLRILPPEGGWATARYEVLRCPASTPALTLEAAEPPEAWTVTALTEGGTTTYVLETTVETEIPVLTEAELSPADENLLRELLADRLDGVTTIRAKGSREAILAGLDLGIVPVCSMADGTLTATFELPELRITAFDPATGTAQVRVIPAEGATITQEVRTGVLQVWATEDLGVEMKAVPDAAFNLQNYVGQGLAGVTLPEAFRLSLGRNLFIKVVADHPAATEQPTGD